MGRIVAIDYGSKRTGIAVTDEGQQFAFALETVSSHQLLKFLEDYIQKNPFLTSLNGYSTMPFALITGL